MFSSSIYAATSAVALLGSFGTCAPFSKRADIDTTVLQFALTLEHLENAFYKQAIQNFTAADFEAAGYSADYYNNLHYIAFDEQTHVQLLTSALTAAKQDPVKACTYKFPYTDVPSFITLSSVLEGVGTSAYLGGAPLITSKEYLTVAGSILAVEALHTSMQRNAIGEIPMANPLMTPIDPTSAFTLASLFITECPCENVALPFTAFPSLTIDGAAGTCEEPDCSAPSTYLRRRMVEGRSKPIAAGGSVKLTAAKDVPKDSYITFVNGLTVTSVPAMGTGMTVDAAIPTGISGQTYVFVTKSDLNGTFVDSSVLFGPAVLEVQPAPVALVFTMYK